MEFNLKVSTSLCLNQSDLSALGFWRDRICKNDRVQYLESRLSFDLVIWYYIEKYNELLNVSFMI